MVAQQQARDDRKDQCNEDLYCQIGLDFFHWFSLSSFVGIKEQYIGSLLYYDKAFGIVSQSIIIKKWIFTAKNTSVDWNKTVPINRRAEMLNAVLKIDCTGGLHLQL